METPPDTTPPEYNTPETPVEHPSTPNETPNNTQPGGGGVLGQEQASGGVVNAAPNAESTLPFTGIELPLLFLTGAVFLGLGLVLHRVSAERG